jgi:hypothetical protein
MRFRHMYTEGSKSSGVRTSRDLFEK